MKQIRYLGLLFCLVLMDGALAQEAVRLRGTISAFDGKVLSMRTREGVDVHVEVPASTGVDYMKALKLEDVKPGTALGTSAVPGADGKLIARELHLFAPERGIPNEGSRPWDLEPNATMTNATVSAMAQATGGRELTLTYKGGSQQVVVPEGIPVVIAVKGERSLLKAGEYVFIAATREASGNMKAVRIQVSKDGVRPPV